MCRARPADEAAKARQAAQPSRVLRTKQARRSRGSGLSFARARRRPKQKQGTATRSSALIFASIILDAPQKSAKRKRMPDAHAAHVARLDESEKISTGPASFQFAGTRQGLFSNPFLIASHACGRGAAAGGGEGQRGRPREKPQRLTYSCTSPRSTSGSCRW